MTMATCYLFIPALILFPHAAALSTPEWGRSMTRKLGTSSLSMNLSSAQQVKVWDNVVPPMGHSRAALQEFAATSGLGHKCFTRPLLSSSNQDSKCNNIIERTIDAILSEIERSAGNNNVAVSTNRCFVEYWTRQEWRHIEAHADVDENLSKQLDQQKCLDGNDLQSTYPMTYQEEYGHRYPTFGHVLYLEVGTNVKGPTCIFPGRSSGRDFQRSIDHESLEGDDNLENVEDGEKEIPMCIVPAVAGRLLRFGGRDLHAVPRPTDIWMLPFVQGSAQYEPKQEWGRSVVLFNVWPGNEHPPLDVPLDTSNWEDQEGIWNIDTPFCNSFSDWKEVMVTQKEHSSSGSDNELNQSVKVWLLGNERRRDHLMRTVSLVAPAKGGREALREALYKDNEVSELILRQHQQ